MRYFLTKSNVAVTVSARLDACVDAVSGHPSPQVTILTPTVVARPASDTSTAYWISPTDAWNLFRSIDSAEIALTDDGRIASSSAKVTDKTVEVLSDLVKVATGFPAHLLGGVPRVGVIPEAHIAAIVPDSAARLVTPKPIIVACTAAALELVTKRAEASKQAASLVAARSAVLQGRVAKEGMRETVATIDEAITKQKLTIQALESRLTKSVTLRLSPKTDDLSFSVTEPIDLASGWLVGGVQDGLVVNATISRTAAARSAETSDEGKDAAGIYYRLPSSEIPAKISVTRNATVSTVPVAIDEVDLLTAANPKGPALLAPGGKYETETDPVRMMQWGRLALMPSDVGWLTSNSVKTSFDEWGVPKSASWSATPATIPSLLGIVNQADAAFGRKPSAPANPVAEQQTEVYLRLLQICKDASPASIPAFCASLVK
jgi:hypothetical protein